MTAPSDQPRPDAARATAALSLRPAGNRRTCVLHVCTSCRTPDCPREPRESRTGFRLYHELRTAVRTSGLDPHVEVRPTECLSICPRPCGIALSSQASWSYLFGDQSPSETVDQIVACLALYLRAHEGVMPRNARPDRLRASILGRVPPIKTAP
ncbi:MAG: DUF1636 domain-containing protein [Myxococcales bacterium FL481]|nr:MAG: DUF1636 domain-containing protein [Myxococcales bacterium FL481]